MHVMRLVTWVIGAVILVGLLAAILSGVFSMFLAPELPYQGFVSRSFYILVLASILCLERIVRGPTASDRIVAIDIFGVLIVGFCAIISVSTGRSWYIDIGIAWSLQSFIGALALSKYLEGKAFDE